MTNFITYDLARINLGGFYYDDPAEIIYDIKPKKNGCYVKVEAHIKLLNSKRKLTKTIINLKNRHQKLMDERIKRKDIIKLIEEAVDATEDWPAVIALIELRAKIESM